MDKALRGQGCVMKRQKKADGGAMRDMPENLKEYSEIRRQLEDKKVNKNVDQKKRSIDNLRSIIEDKTILINREQVEEKDQDINRKIIWLTKINFLKVQKIKKNLNS